MSYGVGYQVHTLTLNPQGSKKAKVLVFSSDSETEYVLLALQAGVAGHLLEDTLMQDLEPAIWSIDRGKSQIDSKLFKKILGENKLINSAGSGLSSTKKSKVSEGEWVQKGQVVALLDNHDVKKAAVEVARHEAELARVNLATQTSWSKNW